VPLSYIRFDRCSARSFVDCGVQYHYRLLSYHMHVGMLPRSIRARFTIFTGAVEQDLHLTPSGVAAAVAQRWREHPAPTGRSWPFGDKPLLGPNARQSVPSRRSGRLLRSQLLHGKRTRHQKHSRPPRNTFCVLKRTPFLPALGDPTFSKPSAATFRPRASTRSRLDNCSVITKLTRVPCSRASPHGHPCAVHPAGATLLTHLGAERPLAGILHKRKREGCVTASST
jgi:hypothetical protein